MMNVWILVLIQFMYNTDITVSMKTIRGDECGKVDYIEPAILGRNVTLRFHKNPSRTGIIAWHHHEYLYASSDKYVLYNKTSMFYLVLVNSSHTDNETRVFARIKQTPDICDSSYVELLLEEPPSIKPLEAIGYCQACIPAVIDRTLNVTCTVPVQGGPYNVTLSTGNKMLGRYNNCSVECIIETRTITDKDHLTGVKCMVVHYTNREILFETTAELFVIVPSTNPQLRVPELKQGDPSNISCIASNARPATNIYLYIENKVVETSPTHEQMVGKLYSWWVYPDIKPRPPAKPQLGPLINTTDVDNSTGYIFANVSSILNLSCNSTHGTKPILVTIRLKGQIIAQCYDTDGICTVNNTIHVIADHHKAKIKCNASNVSKFRVQKKRLFVILQPEAPKITLNKLIDDTSKHLTCETSNARPAPDLEIYVDSKLIKATQQNKRDNKTDQYVSVANASIEASSNVREIKCCLTGWFFNRLCSKKKITYEEVHMSNKTGHTEDDQYTSTWILLAIGGCVLFFIAIIAVVLRVRFKKRSRQVEGENQHHPPGSNQQEPGVPEVIYAQINKTKTVVPKDVPVTESKALFTKDVPATESKALFTKDVPATESNALFTKDVPATESKALFTKDVPATKPKVLIPVDMHATKSKVGHATEPKVLIPMDVPATEPKAAENQVEESSLVYIKLDMDHLNASKPTNNEPYKKDDSPIEYVGIDFAKTTQMQQDIKGYTNQ